MSTLIGEAFRRLYYGRRYKPLDRGSLAEIHKFDKNTLHKVKPIISTKIPVDYGVRCEEIFYDYKTLRHQVATEIEEDKKNDVLDEVEVLKVVIPEKENVEISKTVVPEKEKNTENEEENNTEVKQVNIVDRATQILIEKEKRRLEKLERIKAKKKNLANK